MDTFSLCPTNRDTESDEGPASISINENFYYCSRKKNQTFDPMEITRNGKRIFEEKSNFAFEANSHFSQFHENCLLHMSMWNSYNIVTSGFKGTVASLLSKFYGKQFESFNPQLISYSSSPPEHMVILSLATASHQNLRGRTDGLTFVKEFAIQTQIIDDYGAINDNNLPLRNLITDNVPLILKTFLENFEIPYFVPQITNSGLDKNLKNLVNIGVCKRLADKEGFDLIFDITGTEKKGLVECKNLTANVDREDILNFIYQSFLRESPITIILIRSAGESLRSSKSFNASKAEITLTENLPIIKESPEKRVKTQESEKVKVNIFEEMSKNKFNINVYSLLYNKDSNKKNPEEMSFNTLKEVENPQGVFLIIESNAELKDPTTIPSNRKGRDIIGIEEELKKI